MPRTRTHSSALLTLAAVVVAIAALYFAKEILLPLALAILLSFLLTPPANRLESWGFGRIGSVLTVVVITFALLGCLSWVVTSQLMDLSLQLPRYRDRLITKIQAVVPKSGPFDEVTETLEDVEKAVAGNLPDKDEPRAKDAEANDDDAEVTEPDTPGEETLEPWGDWYARLSGRGELDQSNRPIDVRIVGLPPSPLRQVLDWMGPLVAPLMTAGIVVVLVIFILIQREDQRNRLIQLFGASHLHATTEALTDVTDRVSRYLRMQFLINAGYGVLVGVGLSLLGLPNGVMWGVLSFSLRFLPYIGPWLSAVMPLAVSVATSDGWGQPLMVVCWFCVLELLVNTVAEPLLYGRSTGVSGVGVIVAAVFWTWIWGAIGLVLAMPLTVCLVVMAKYIPALRFLTVLLGDRPTMATEERIYQRLLAGDADEAQELVLACLAEATLVDVYDSAVIPAMRLAEHDRHAGLLQEDQEEIVYATARVLVEDLPAAASRSIEARSTEEDKPAPEPAATDSPRLKAICIPLRDSADETAAIMLRQLLADEAIDVELASDGALTGELVDLVESLHCDVAVVSIVPPLPARNSRLLCRRLRDRYPELPIIVGYWSGETDMEPNRRLAAAGDAEIISTLAEVVDRLRAIAQRTLPARLEVAAEPSGEAREN